ncbi:MAG: O-antigen ligase family protein [Candidatus Moranbacteria bacterium]|nr:O-antigen ligase family protein [Candidatus Moranbacteria bacterium]MBP6034361.1 O-antigen ligase family protein [Candidatus Moranbacteria bacterium]
MERTWKYLLYAFVGLLPLQTVYLLREVFIGGEKWQYGTIAVYVSDSILFSVLILFFISGDYAGKIFDFRYWIFDLKSRIKNLKSESVLPIALILWAGLSILWAPDQMLAGYFVMKLALAVGVFLMVRSLDEKESRIAVLLVVIGAVLEGALGVWQFLAQSTFASTLLGMSAHEAGQAGTSVLKLGDGRWLRAYGTLPHPNMLGGFLAAALVLGIGYLTRFGKDSLCTVLMSRAELRESGASLWDRFIDTVRMSGITLAGAMLLLGLLLTFSRSAWLGAALGITVLATYFFFQSKSAKSESNIIPRPSDYVTFYKTIFVLVAVGIAFVGVLRTQIFPRFDSAVIAAEGSVSERVQSLWDAERVIGEGNILIGTGVGNFTAEMMRLQPDRPVWSIQPAHNVFVLIFAELGLVGFVLFIGFLAPVILSAVKNPEIPRQARNDKGYRVMSIAALGALLPSLLLDHWLWTSHFGLLLLSMLLGIAARKYGNLA